MVLIFLFTDSLRSLAPNFLLTFCLLLCCNYFSRLGYKCVDILVWWTWRYGACTLSRKDSCQLSVGISRILLPQLQRADLPKGMLFLGTQSHWPVVLGDKNPAISAQHETTLTSHFCSRVLHLVTIVDLYCSLTSPLKKSLFLHFLSRYWSLKNTLHINLQLGTCFWKTQPVLSVT